MEKIEYIEGDTHSQFTIPNHLVGNVLQLLRKNKQQVEKVEMNDKELDEAKTFLRRVPQFMITAFISYLDKKQKCDCIKNILKKLEDLKQGKESNQRKYEKGDLRQLVLKEDFVQILDNFLCSRELWVYIRDNKKIKQDETRLLYWKCVSLILEEIKKKKSKFQKFLSDKNAKIIAENLKYIRSIEKLRDHPFFKELPQDAENHLHNCPAESNSSENISEEFDQFSNPPFQNQSCSENSNEVSTQHRIFYD